MFPLEAARQLKALSDEAISSIRHSEPTSITGETARLAEARLSQAIQAAMTAVVTASNATRAAKQYYNVDVPAKVKSAVSTVKADAAQAQAAAVSDAWKKAMSDKEEALANATKEAKLETGALSAS